MFNFRFSIDDFRLTECMQKGCKTMTEPVEASVLHADLPFDKLRVRKSYINYFQTTFSMAQFRPEWAMINGELRIKNGKYTCR
ncbi:MAG: hypothetical protein ACI9EW_001059 [Cellvibrionaceae bacterium]|jgi:hypothetical protein